LAVMMHVWHHDATRSWRPSSSKLRLGRARAACLLRRARARKARAVRGCPAIPKGGVGRACLSAWGLDTPLALKQQRASRKAFQGAPGQQFRHLRPSAGRTGCRCVVRCGRPSFIVPPGGAAWMGFAVSNTCAAADTRSDRCYPRPDPLQHQNRVQQLLVASTTACSVYRKDYKSIIL